MSMSDPTPVGTKKIVEYVKGIIHDEAGFSMCGYVARMCAWFESLLEAESPHSPHLPVHQFTIH